MTDHSGADGPVLETGSHIGHWHKSSKSTFNGNCIEVGTIINGNSVLVRDTKDPEPTLEFAADVWSSFISQIKEDSI